MKAAAPIQQRDEVPGLGGDVGGDHPQDPGPCPAGAAGGGDPAEGRGHYGVCESAAPKEWSRLATRRGRMWARRTQMATEEGSSTYFHVPMNYEVWRADMGEWQRRQGLVPRDEQSIFRVEVRLSKQPQHQDWFEEPKETSFTRKQRKMIEKAWKHMKMDVSEVYSPPRVAAEATRAGMKAGTSFDLLTGWDLSDPQARKERWKK